MSKQMKIWLIIAASAVLLGTIIFAGAMTVMKWDFTKLSTVKYEENTHSITKEYKNILIVTDTADVSFIPSNDAKTAVVCNENIKAKHSVSVKEDTLVIEIKDERKWYDYIGIDFGSKSQVKVYIPVGEYGSLSIEDSTGDVKIPNNFKFDSISVFGSTGDVECSAFVSGKVKVAVSTGCISVNNTNVGALDLEVSTGNIRLVKLACAGDIEMTVSTGNSVLYNLSCSNMHSKGTTGDIEMSGVIASGNISIERGTGDIEFDRCDAQTLKLKTSTGDVEGSLLSDKVFVYETSTGDVKLPKTTTGGICEVKTSTGDIEIEIVGK